MFSIKSLFKAVQTWRRRGGGPKTTKRADIALERLDHRQLLSVTFTGNPITDIPATTAPGTVILQDTGAVRHPFIPFDLRPAVKVSGLDINGIRMNYDPNTDILSVGIQQPDNQKTGQPVLAGDTDNNGDGGTVSPAVQALRPGQFTDFIFLGGSESMGAFLDFNNDGVPDVVAGIGNSANSGKLYQVADAVVNPDPAVAASTVPGFGTTLQDNTGSAFLSNSPSQPNFEFQITNFSQLYQAKTGQPLATTSVIGVGAFGTSNDDDGISEAFFPAQAANFGVIPPTPPPPPPPPPPCPPPVVPPLQPPIVINPHENRHVNIAHPTDIRVSLFGSSNFDVGRIVPESVRLGGAGQIFNITRDINHDKVPDRTFVFRGSDISLPPGVQRAVVSGNLQDGTAFQSASKIFVRDDSSYSPAQIAARDARQAREKFDPPLTPFQRKSLGLHTDAAIEQGATLSAQAFTPTSTVKIATRGGAQGVSVDSSVASRPQGVGSPAGQWSSHGAGTVTSRRPVAQAEAPVTVKIPRRASLSVPDATPTGVKLRPLAAVPTRPGMARAARSR